MKKGKVKVLRQEAKRKGRPEKLIKLDATPEEAAKAIFSAVKPPDPSKRVKPLK